MSGDIRITRHPIAGALRWKLLPDGKVEILDNWKLLNLEQVHIPILAKKFRVHFVWFHYRAVQQLLRAFEEVYNRGLVDKILSWDGSFAERTKRNSDKLSMHALGLAFDINAKWNPQGKIPAKWGTEGSTRELAQVFARHGFLWGGKWKGEDKDGMHFEVKQIIE